MTLKAVFEKIIHKVTSYFKNWLIKFSHKYKSSYYFGPLPYNHLNSRFKMGEMQNVSKSDLEVLSQLCKYYLDHRFNLLGSGWVTVARGMVCSGLAGYKYQNITPSNPSEDFVGSPNFCEVSRIWALIDKDYSPIDWHLDFKSGYRWRPNMWHKDIPYGVLPGVDIKIPWELARFQHLPQLALAKICADKYESYFMASKLYVDEFRNQVLDFIASNPPQCGVNWVCAMDVGIRAANLLTSYDLFRSSGVTFDSEFEQIFARSIYEHGKHIINNLEGSQELRGNHYLADISGLLFIASYLPETKETNSWLAFSVQELISEVDSQFYDDGANFEASTSYHRLSSEMVLYSTSLILGFSKDDLARLQNYEYKKWKFKPLLMPSPLRLYPLNMEGVENDLHLSPFPDGYFEKIQKMAEFTFHITKHSGRIPQIGDNDNGRFLKLSLAYSRLTAAEAVMLYKNLQGYQNFNSEEIYLDEDHLDHRHLVSAINTLFKRKDFENFSDGNNFESFVITMLAGGKVLKCNHRNESLVSSAEKRSLMYPEVELGVKFIADKSSVTHKYSFEGYSLLNGLQRFSYPDFGIYIFKSNRLFLSIRAGSVGQSGFGGHAHNDQLCVELQVDGADVLVDPGTAVYTPLPNLRNKYRSIHAHFAPAIDNQEPVLFDDGLFRLSDSVCGYCEMFQETEIICRAAGAIVPIYRHVKINENAVFITDYFSGGHTISSQKSPLPFSPGYGEILAND